ncbi:uncharacterized protein MELLADRAFT_115401 [Melampsora larici-populina 98AG31]|uniref:Uncharacterized protein n=1 Tax=Melampsora larici-populina (strain 98AG31 / pathotype 3-4-7) TaxID=747676 RepID=F4RA68_MELLP|nr:uncharacterized protein MELLADRAFT_115401 [Melampsora larici-populina 98AG31]EGG10833.1 hypothetical protein MELLADRAFT_115401 [Melampsora larici-populina 98AG31]
MSSSEEKKILDFVLHLPPDINPYGAVAKHMKGLLTPPRLATWATIAQRCAIAFYIILFVQSSHLIYSRVKVGAYKFWRYTRRECSQSLSHLGASCDGRTPITSLYQSDYIRSTWRVPAGQPMPSIVSSFYGSVRTSGAGRRLHPAIRVSMNALLLALHLSPIPLVIYYYAGLNHEYNISKSILQGVLHELHAKAATVTPGNYSPMALLATLKPAQNIQLHAHKMAEYTRNGIMVYLVELTVLSVVYVPLLTFSLGRLYSRSVSQKKLTQAASSGEAGDNISKMGRKIREQRTRLVTHAIITYATTALHVPIIIAQLSYEGDGFLRDKKWLTLTRVMLDSRARNRTSSGVTSSFSNSNNAKETFMPKLNPAYGDKDMELSILPRFPGLNSELHVETLDTRKCTTGTFAVSSNQPGGPMHITTPGMKSDSKPVMKKLKSTIDQLDNEGQNT